jgi:transcription elongation factor Elf1
MNERIRIDRIEFEGIELEQIESVNFDTINVCGLPVPNEEMLTAGAKTMPDRESESLFWFKSNIWVNDHQIHYNPQAFLWNEPWEIEESKLRSRLIEIVKIQAEICGYDFRAVMQANAVTSWFRQVLGNHNGVNNQQLRKATSMLKSVYEGHADLLSVKLPHVADYSHLEILGENLIYDKYSIKHQYSFACVYAKRFDRAVLDLKFVNEGIKKSLSEREDIREKIRKIAKDHPSESPHSFQCPYCKKYQLTQGFTQIPTSCGSKECKLKYDKELKRKTRALKQDGVLVDFVKGYGGKRKRCKTCKKKRYVTNDRICEPCLKEAVCHQ